MTRTVLLLLAVGACKTEVVELGKVDAAVDAARDAPADATACRCRITPCRVPGDCAVIGGACGPDFYCVGDFGACTLDSQCQATVTGSVCTQGTASTLACR